MFRWGICREQGNETAKGRRLCMALFCSAAAALLISEAFFLPGIRGKSKERAGLDRLKAEAEKNTGQSAAVPDSYEVHLMLDSDQLLDEDHKLREEYCETFETKKKVKEFGLVYCDTTDQQFREKGWINRIRFREDKPEKGFKVTFKKRYPVSGGDISGAMKQAESDGFDLTGETWSSEIDWGYSEMALSLSAESECEAGGYESIADLDRSAALSLLEVNMPEEEVNWSSELWGSRTLESASLAGPVYFRRYTGSYLGQETRIEVWSVIDRSSEQASYLTELSFKTESYDQAAEFRQKMIDDLDGQKILLKEDDFKTQKILDAYLGKS